MAQLQADIARERSTRSSSTTSRKGNVQTKNTISMPLLDALQITCGYLICCRHDLKVTPALESYGFKVVARRSAAQATNSGAASTSEGAEAPAGP